MKKQLIIMGFLAIASLNKAQTWGGSGSQSGDAYRTGKVGAGTTSPGNQLHVSTGTAGDGVKITQTGNGAVGLHFDPSTGHDWSLYATGSSDGWGGANDFAIHDATSEPDFPRFFIDGADGYVGIGTVSPIAKLHVATNDDDMPDDPEQVSGSFLQPTAIGGYFDFQVTGQRGVHAAAQGYDLNNASPAGGYLCQGIGLFGKAERTSTVTGNTGCIGVYGRGEGSDLDIGGAFYGATSETIGDKSATPSKKNATGFGVWASALTSEGAAAYFNGISYSNGFYQGADAKLQKDVKPLTSVLDKIKTLKANTFSFNATEFQTMNLPAEKQMGLNVDDIANAFPDLVREFKDVSNQLKTGKTSDMKSYKAINYTNLIPVLIAGMQEQQQQIEEQRQMINDLINKSQAPSGINQNNPAIDGLNLEQNIPNPFSDQTIIKYTLSEQINSAYMAVYDLSGKQITKFPLDQKGTSFITITSEKLAAGIYLYSIIADGKVMDSKRMIVAEKQ